MIIDDPSVILKVVTCDHSVQNNTNYGFFTAPTISGAVGLAQVADET